MCFIISLACCGKMIIFAGKFNIKGLVMKVDKMNRTMWVLGGAIAVVLVIIIVIAVISVSKNANQGSENSNGAVSGETGDQTAEHTEAATPTPEPSDEPSSETEATPTPEPTPTEEPSSEEQTVLTVIYSEDFEDGAHEFVSRGNELLELVEDAYSGAYALRIIGRTNTWNGAKVSMDNYFEVGRTFYVEAYVKFESDTDTNDTLQLSLQYNNAEGEKYSTIGNAVCTAGEWTKISGYIQVPEDCTGSMYLYLETNDGTKLNNIYLDDFKVAIE